MPHLRQANVDDEQKHRRTGDFARQLVLERRELRDELCGQVGLGNVFGVVRRKVVARETKRARPQLAGKVNLAVWGAGRGEGV